MFSACISSNHAEMHSITAIHFCFPFIEGKCLFLTLHQKYLPETAVIVVHVVATCFLARLNIILASTLRCAYLIHFDPTFPGVHTCFVCKKTDKETRRCSIGMCGRFYHEDCLKVLPQARIEGKTFICPLHGCATCYSDNPKSIKANKGI
jgi:hypothetical protein